MKKLLWRLWLDEEAQDLTEYGLLLVLIALAAIASMKSFAVAVSTMYSSATATVSSS